MKYCILISCLSFFHFSLPAQAPPVDVIIFNAKVRTLDTKNPVAEAIAVSGNKIKAIGKSKDIRKLANARTKIIDARDRLVLPGFNDAHVHFTAIGNQFSSINLRDAKSPQEIVERLKNYVRFLPKGRWILGGGWNNENWRQNSMPTKELIDAATPDNPVFIYHQNPKIALVNSLALKLARLEKKSNAGNDLTGILRGSAIELVRKITPDNHIKTWPEIIETASNYAASLGVTSVQDMHSDDLFGSYRELARQGKLKTRIYDCTPLSEWSKLANRGVRRADGDAMVRRGCLKFFSDGDAESRGELYNNILAADKAGLQVMMHAIGPSANDIILSIFEDVAKENGIKDRRFRIEHAYDFREQDLKRFAASKTIASMQPHLFWGNEPYRSLLNSETLLAFGSDASMTDLNPLLGIADAVNENGDESITVGQAVRAYTIGSAYAEFQEHLKGTIEVGKLADLIILSDDIFMIDPVKIRNAKVIVTIVDGRIVYEEKNFRNN